MKTIFRSKFIVTDKDGKNPQWKSATYQREKPKENLREVKAAKRRDRHAEISKIGIFRRLNGNKLGLRKREQILAEV